MSFNLGIGSVPLPSEDDAFFVLYPFLRQLSGVLAPLPHTTFTIRFIVEKSGRRKWKR